jgi:acyl-coenzyme A thioesterase PaaI-like protein
MSTTAARLAAAWRLLSRLPGGRRLFGRILGLMVPYSGSIRPHVRALEPGRAVVSIRERRRLRNHLRSVHAIALANLGELASGLAMTLALPPETRGIPIRIEIDYRKKARGTITAHGRAAPPPAIPEDIEEPATAVLTDEDGEVVAELVVTWRLGPREEN